uniref:7TM_GPCR_Srx domain-containing protein n=1 Tax=Macrostomum lignano TaxID=282301 RepID=A0A1I8I8R6_9PLAT
MPDFIIVGNGSHECENATEQNEQYLANNPMLRPYYGLMIGLTLTNSLLNFACLMAFQSMRPKRRFNFLLARLSLAEAMFQAVFCCNQVLVLAMDSNRLLLPNRHLAVAVAALGPITLFLGTALHVSRNWAVVLIGRHRWLAVARSDRPSVEEACSAKDCRLLAGGLALC